jgi:hypothetical protein
MQMLVRLVVALVIAALLLIVLVVALAIQVIKMLAELEGAVAAPACRRATWRRNRAQSS